MTNEQSINNNKVIWDMSKSLTLEELQFDCGMYYTPESVLDFIISESMMHFYAELSVVETEIILINMITHDYP